MSEKMETELSRMVLMCEDGIYKAERSVVVGLTLAAQDISERRIAMNDLLNSPKGVVPASAEKFYNDRSGIFK